MDIDGGATDRKLKVYSSTILIDALKCPGKCAILIKFPRKYPYFGDFISKTVAIQVLNSVAIDSESQILQKGKVSAKALRPIFCADPDPEYEFTSKNSLQRYIALGRVHILMAKKAQMRSQSTSSSLLSAASSSISSGFLWASRYLTSLVASR